MVGADEAPLLAVGRKVVCMNWFDMWFWFVLGILGFFAALIVISGLYLAHFLERHDDDQGDWF